MSSSTNSTPLPAGRTTVRFASGDEEIVAWLDRPAAAGPAPAVVLGHGLGGIKEMGLGPYAERFAAAGFVCLSFDYRHFGESTGEPRLLLDIGRQQADWRAAVAYARALPGVDPDRVAIFGSSFGGGHALVTAARDPRIAAVIAQCPFVDGLASARVTSMATKLRLAPLVVGDELARLRGAEPVRVALSGPPGSAALMSAPDAMDGHLALVPEDVHHPDAVPARVAPRISLYRPIRQASRIAAPVLFSVCDRDTVAPAKATLRCAARIRRAEVCRYPVGHFEIYAGEPFERAVADQVDFLTRHL
jgi:uncharacterized protein